MHTSTPVHSGNANRVNHDLDLEFLGEALESLDSPVGGFSGQRQYPVVGSSEQRQLPARSRYYTDPLAQYNLPRHQQNPRLQRYHTDPSHQSSSRDTNQPITETSQTHHLHIDPVTYYTGSPLRDSRRLTNSLTRCKDPRHQIDPRRQTSLRRQTDPRHRPDLTRPAYPNSSNRNKEHTYPLPGMAPYMDIWSSSSNDRLDPAHPTDPHSSQQKPPIGIRQNVNYSARPVDLNLKLWSATDDIVWSEGGLPQPPVRNRNMKFSGPKIQNNTADGGNIASPESELGMDYVETQNVVGSHISSWGHMEGERNFPILSEGYMRAGGGSSILAGITDYINVNGILSVEIIEENVVVNEYIEVSSGSSGEDPYLADVSGEVPYLADVSNTSSDVAGRSLRPGTDWYGLRQREIYLEHADDLHSDTESEGERPRPKTVSVIVFDSDVARMTDDLAMDLDLDGPEKNVYVVNPQKPVVFNANRGRDVAPPPSGYGTPPLISTPPPTTRTPPTTRAPRSPRSPRHYSPRQQDPISPSIINDTPSAADIMKRWQLRDRQSKSEIRSYH